MFWTHTSHWRSLGMVALVAFVTACSLNGTPPTLVPTATLVPPDAQSGGQTTYVVVPGAITATPMFVVQAAFTPTPGPVAPTAYVPPAVAYTPLSVPLPANCQVHTDWQPYTVQAGDTLGVLAINTNTALTDLIVGNCLANPDVITVGQTLYLPQAPLASPPAALSPAPGVSAPQIGFVLIEPALVKDGAYMVAPGVLTLRAEGVNNAASVTFYLSIIGTTTPPTALGTDTTLSDGATLVWQLGPTPLRANVWATAFGADNLIASTNPILIVNNG